MENENTIKYIDYLKNYWQLLTFWVFTLGFITFSFYMDINGFSFVVPDLKFLIAFGIIGTITALPLIFFINKKNTHWKTTFILIALVPVFITTHNPYYTLLLLSFILVDIAWQFDKIRNASNYYEQILKTLLIPVVLTQYFFIGFEYIALLGVNAFFLFNIKLNKERNNPTTFIFFVFYMLALSYMLSLIINKNGLSIADMRKTNIELITDKNQTIAGVLVFQDSNTLYIASNNERFSIDRSRVVSPIQYKEYKYEHNNSIFGKIKSFF